MAEPKETPTIPNPEIPPGSDTPENKDPEPKMLTQEEVNSIVAAERKGATTKEAARILKELGFEKLEDAQAAIKKQKEAEDAQKTEAQKLADQLKAEQTKNAQTAAELEKERNFKGVIENGVDPKKAKAAVVLLSQYEGETIKDKTEAMLKDHPYFAQGYNATTQKVGNAFDKQGEHAGDAELDSIFDIKSNTAK